MPNHYNYRALLLRGIELEKMAHELLETSEGIVRDAKEELSVQELEEMDDLPVNPMSKKEQKKRKKENKAKDLAILALKKK